MKVPRKLLSFLKKEDKFFIATHVNPEGDALGSSIALSMALESLGKKTLLYEKDTVPHFYYYLPGHEKFMSSIPPKIYNLDAKFPLLNKNLYHQNHVDLGFSTSDYLWS